MARLTEECRWCCNRLKQGAVAVPIGVSEPSVFNREANRLPPDFRHMPAIIEFLGYHPLWEPDSARERLVRDRVSQGLFRKEAARRLGVDPGTLAPIEPGGQRVATGGMGR